MVVNTLLIVSNIVLSLSFSFFRFCPNKESVIALFPINAERADIKISALQRVELAYQCSVLLPERLAVSCRTPSAPCLSGTLQSLKNRVSLFHDFSINRQYYSIFVFIMQYSGYTFYLLSQSSPITHFGILQGILLSPLPSVPQKSVLVFPLP